MTNTSGAYRIPTSRVEKSLPAWLFNRQLSPVTSKGLPLLILEQKRFRFELSSFNKKVCIYEFGGSGKRFPIWFDLRGSLWLLDSIASLISSGKPPFQFVQRNGNRTLKLNLRSNRYGKFLKVIESRQFGRTYFCVPEGKRGIGFQMFLADLRFSVHSLRALSEDPPILGPVEADEGWVCSVERVSVGNPMSISESLLQMDVNMGLLDIIDSAAELHFDDGISQQMGADRNGGKESEAVSQPLNSKALSSKAAAQWERSGILPESGVIDKGSSSSAQSSSKKCCDGSSGNLATQGNIRLVP